MSDHNQIMKNISKDGNVDYPVLVPNVKGLESAVGNNHSDETLHLALKA